MSNSTPTTQRDNFRDDGETSADSQSVARVANLGRGGVGRYQQVMDVTGIHTTTDIPIDNNLTTLEEYNKSLAIMTRQRRWIRCLSILALALAIDVIFLSVKLTKINKAAEAEESKEKENGDEPNDTVEYPNWMPLPASDELITTIAFGSCSSQYMPQPYLDTVVRLKPDMLLLGGDNVYGECQEESCQHLKDAYLNWTQYASFRGATESLPMIATLDDHDYGVRHADKTNPYKQAAKDLFHEFYYHLETVVPKDDGDGVYQVYTWGPPGKRLQVILLDTRYHKDRFPPNSDDADSTLVPPKAPFKPSTSLNQQMLSDRQWEWLEQVVSEPDIQIRFLVSSMQVLNDATGFECWRHLPKERERLYNLLRRECTSPLYLLSGDRRVGGFYQIDFEPDNITTTARSTLGRQSLVEVTASSWTHTIPYGAYDNCTDAVTCDEEDPRRTGDFVRENNFATVQIDWDNGNVTLALRRAETPPAYLYHGQNHEEMVSTGQILQARSFKFRDLQPHIGL